MNKHEAEAHDALVAFEERQKRHAAGYPPAPRAVATAVWAPRMTEQQKAELEQQIADGIVPF